MRNTAGGALPRWDDNVERHDRAHSPTVAKILLDVQSLFIERLQAWTHSMAPTGWRRQARWHGREWMRLVFFMIRSNVHGRARRLAALRRIASCLRAITPTSRYRLILEQRAYHVKRCRAYARIGAVLWYIYRNHRAGVACLELPPVEPAPSPLTQWTRSPRTPVLNLRHDMSCLERYVRWIVSPSLRARKAQLLAAAIKKRAMWRICAYLVATYRQSLHEDLLAARASSRHGLVCAHTRNAQRLRPKRGVNYDEKDRRPNRILPTETYRTHRWPLRDKCGPTLAAILYYLWGIT